MPIGFKDLKQNFTSILKDFCNTTVSFYVPSSPVWDQTEPSRIMLKNLIKTAESELREKGNNPAVYLEELDKRSESKEFWKHHSEGLAVFCGQDKTLDFAVPYNFEPKVAVDQRIYIKPLIPSLYKDYEYFLLSLSQKSVKLYKGFRENLETVESSLIPESIDAALWVDEPQKSLQHKSSKKVGAGTTGGMVYHGHNEYKEIYKTNLSRFSHIVDSAINELLVDETLPLVIACDMNLYSIYAEANEYANLVLEYIDGDPTQKSLKELGEKAWAILRSKAQSEKEEFIKTYSNLIGTGNVSDNIEEIVILAYEGRVEALFVNPNFDTWGTYSPTQRKVELHENKSQKDTELGNFAAVNTLIKGGMVYTIDAQEHMFTSPFSAVLRF